MEVSSVSSSSGSFVSDFTAQISVSWSNNQDDYELQDFIGVGARAVVYRAFCMTRGEKCAIKRINLKKWNTSMDELLKEFQAMSSCNHENVVTYYTSFVVADELWLVLKLLEGGSLLDVIIHKVNVTNCKHGLFDEATIATVLKEVLKGLEYFHSNGQIHGDIKAGNILLGEDGAVQIADFGVSAWLATGPDVSRRNGRRTLVGTPGWMAPEVLELEHECNFRADIWSVGITAIEMATGNAPYHKFPPMKASMLTIQEDPPTLDTGADEKEQYKAYGKTFRKMIIDCLQKDPTKRPSAPELLRHQFFRKAKDKKYLTQTLIAAGPSMETRVNKASERQAGMPCRLHRAVAGEWLWTEDQLQRTDSLGSDHEEASNLNVSIQEDERNDPWLVRHEEPPVVKLVLRMRNAHRELTDIRFEYDRGKDTSEGIAAELVGAGLVSARDAVPVAQNLARLLEAGPTPAARVLTFGLNCFPENEVFDEHTLIGFAQLSIVE